MAFGIGSMSKYQYPRAYLKFTFDLQLGWAEDRVFLVNSA